MAGKHDNENSGTKKDLLFGKKKKKPPTTANPDAIEERNRAQANGLMYAAPYAQPAMYGQAPYAQPSMYGQANVDEDVAPTYEPSKYLQPIDAAPVYEPSKYLQPIDAAPVYEPSKYLQPIDAHHYDEVDEDEDEDDGVVPYQPDDVGPAPAVVAAPAPAVNAPHNHDPFGLGKGHLVTSPLLEQYRGEHKPGFDHQGHLPDQLWDKSVSNTQYAQGPDSHRATVQDGKLHRPGGEVADSTAAKRMWRKDKDDRLNFAMDQHGSTYLSDPKVEAQANKDAADADGKSSIERINHTTMVGGGDVAGAGTAKIRDGKVEALGDGSGHYQPAITQTAQVASTMAAQGVLDPARASIELSGKGKKADGYTDQQELTISAQELLSYGEGKDDKFALAKERAANAKRFGADDDAQKAHLAAPEAQIRARHEAKDRMLAQLLGTVPRSKDKAAPMPGMYVEPELGIPAAPQPQAPIYVDDVGQPEAQPQEAPAMYSEVDLGPQQDAPVYGAPNVAHAPTVYSEPVLEQQEQPQEAPTVYSEPPVLASKPSKQEQPAVLPLPDGYSWPNLDKRKKRNV